MKTPELYCASDHTKHKTGEVTYRKGFFYTFGMNGEKFAEQVSDELTSLNVTHKIVEFGCIWKPFKGGQSTKAGSHFWVRVSFCSDKDILPA